MFSFHLFDLVELWFWGQGAIDITNLCQAVLALEAHFLDSEPLIYQSSGHTI